MRVPRATVAPPFSSRAIQYGVAGNQYESSYYHNWAADPGALVAAVARDLMVRRGVIVAGPGSEANHTATVELYVSKLAMDVTGERPMAVLVMRATLLDADGAVQRVRTFESRQPAASAEAADAVTALNSILVTELMTLASEVAAGPLPAAAAPPGR